MARTRIFDGLGKAMLMTAALGLSVTACKKPDPNARHNARTVKASVAEFDPASVELDLNKWGTKRVDDYLVQEAFNRSFDGMDRCIAEHKQRKGIPEDRTLQGTADFEVQLNPETGRPFAVNAKLSDGSLDKEKELSDCLREVVADVGFPTYDGPPQVAEFSVQPLDAGYAYEYD
jgi:hypothetical protein